MNSENHSNSDYMRCEGTPEGVPSSAISPYIIGQPGLSPDFPKSDLPDLQSVMRRLRADIAAIPSGEYSPAEAAAMVRLIFCHLKGWDQTDLVIHAPDKISPFILSRISQILTKLRQGAPLQYILGQGRFYGMDLEVNPSTLIPRPETEELIDLITDRFADHKDLRVLDIGTGSGAIAIALSRNLCFSEVSAIDISEDALDVARRNARKLHADISFIHADILNWEPKPQSLDIIVSNPPYICESEKKEMQSHVLDYEPETALFVPDSDPLLFYRRIAQIGLKALTSGGMIYFEINPLQSDAMTRLMQNLGYQEVSLHQDISHRLRFLSARHA